MFKDTDEFRQLADIYSQGRDDSIGLYLGAGVNKPPPAFKGNIKYKAYDWGELLKEVYERNRDQYDKSFEEMKERSMGNWAELAEALVGNMGTEYLTKQLDQILYQTMSRIDKDGRLEKDMLDQAPTLHAAICFSTKIKSKNEKVSNAATWTFVRNPRIGTVITPNYDYFFGAGWTRYQSFRTQWKVTTPFPGLERTGSKRRSFKTQRSINYIHGYIPYRLNPNRDVVLTTEKYHEFYKSDGFARQTLEDVFGNHTIIFVGTSISDEPIIEILKKAKREQGSTHFVIERSPTTKKLDELDEMGITPISVDDYAEISQVLEEIYCIGLESSDWERFGLDVKDYWKRLKAGPNKKLLD